MLFDGMSEEAMVAWTEVKSGAKLFIDLSPELKSQFLEIEMWNKVDDDIKKIKQERAFGQQGSDYQEDPRDRPGRHLARRPGTL